MDKHVAATMTGEGRCMTHRTYQHIRKLCRKVQPGCQAASSNPLDAGL